MGLYDKFVTCIWRRICEYLMRYFRLVLSYWRMIRNVLSMMKMLVSHIWMLLFIFNVSLPNRQCYSLYSILPNFLVVSCSFIQTHQNCLSFICDCGLFASIVHRSFFLDAIKFPIRISGQFLKRFTLILIGI